MHGGELSRLSSPSVRKLLRQWPSAAAKEHLLAHQRPSTLDLLGMRTARRHKKLPRTCIFSPILYILSGAGYTRHGKNEDWCHHSFLTATYFRHLHWHHHAREETYKQMPKSCLRCKRCSWRSWFQPFCILLGEFSISHTHAVPGLWEAPSFWCACLCMYIYVYIHIFRVAASCKHSETTPSLSLYIYVYIHVYAKRTLCVAKTMCVEMIWKVASEGHSGSRELSPGLLHFVGVCCLVWLSDPAGSGSNFNHGCTTCWSNGHLTWRSMLHPTSRFSSVS